jgi:hypothetical protein
MVDDPENLKDSECGECARLLRKVNECVQQQHLSEGRMEGLSRKK